MSAPTDLPNAFKATSSSDNTTTTSLSSTLPSTTASSTAPKKSFSLRRLVRTNSAVEKASRFGALSPIKKIFSTHKRTSTSTSTSTSTFTSASAGPGTVAGSGRDGEGTMAPPPPPTPIPSTPKSSTSTQFPYTPRDRTSFDTIRNHDHSYGQGNARIRHRAHVSMDSAGNITYTTESDTSTIRALESPLRRAAPSQYNSAYHEDGYSNVDSNSNVDGRRGSIESIGGFGADGGGGMGAGGFGEGADGDGEMFRPRTPLSDAEAAQMMAKKAVAPNLMERGIKNPHEYELVLAVNDGSATKKQWEEWRRIVRGEMDKYWARKEGRA